MITARDLALEGCRLFESSDVEDTRSRISAVMQPHQLKPIGSGRDLRAHMDFIDVAGLGLGAIKFGRMRVSLGRIEDYHLIILCRRGAAVVRTPDGEIELNQYRGACLSPGQPLRAEFSEDCEQFVVRIDNALFQKHTGMQHPRLRSAIDLSHPGFQSWGRVLWALAGSWGLARQQPELGADYQRLLLGLLMRTAALDPVEESSSVAPSGVKRAEAFIQENTRKPICLEEIARAAQTPARTLHASFRRFRQTSPMSYLRDLRLDRVRQRLLDRTNSRTVTDVAMEEGFAHLGRFAGEYVARFGEKPSETARQARRGWI